MNQEEPVTEYQPTEQERETLLALGHTTSLLREAYVRSLDEAGAAQAAVKDARQNMEMAATRADAALGFLSTARGLRGSVYFDGRVIRVKG